VTEDSSISDVSVEVARDTSLGLNAEGVVFNGMNMSGVSTMPWNEVVEAVCSVRPRV
jgi:hypothetical protein